MKTYTSRNDVPVHYTWDLTTLYPNDAAWQKAYQQIAARLPKLAALRGTLGKSGAALLGALQLQDEISAQFERLWRYAQLHKDEDTTNGTYQALADRAKQLYSRLQESVAFVDPEILAIPPTTLDKFMRDEPGLEDYRHSLDNLNRQRLHLRSAEVEAILAATTPMALSPNDIFSMINDADLQLPTIKDGSGKKVQLTHGSYQRFLRSTDRHVRQAAFEGMMQTFHKQRHTLATTYFSSIKTDLFYQQQRGYNSCLEQALSSANIPLEVYAQLITTVREHLPLLHRYLRLRKKLLGLDELHMYDLYVPMVAEPGGDISYEAAVSTVKKALEPLGEVYGAALERALTERWIDVFETPNKRSGAYSMSGDNNPFILLNFQNNRDSMYTLAHELGHAMHSHFYHSAQPFHYAGTKTFTAEVASTVNEGLMTAYLLKTTDNPAERIAILNHSLEDIRGALIRQTMFAEFEKTTHEKAEAGEALTAESLSATYYELAQAYYGPETIVDDAVTIEWARVPHFYRSFYVYQYATGISAATALVRSMLEEGKPAVERYLGFLRAGVSDYSIAVLQRAGVDMTSPEPIRQTFTMFESHVSQLEALVE